MVPHTIELPATVNDKKFATALSKLSGPATNSEGKIDARKLKRRIELWLAHVDTLLRLG